MARRKKGLAAQKGLVALVALVSVGVLGYFTFMVVDEQSNAQFEEGTHFETLATPRRVRGDEIEVMEFFSYGCIHCFRLEDQLEDWQATIDDGVKFVKRPLIGSDAWRVLGQHFHTLESLEASSELHRITFSAIHNGLRRFESGEELAAFIEDNSDIDAQTYLSHWNSPRVASELALSDRLSRQSQVSSVPTIVVDGKYRVSVNRLVGPTRLFDVTDYLVSETRVAESSAGS